MKCEESCRITHMMMPTCYQFTDEKPQGPRPFCFGFGAQVLLSEQQQQQLALTTGLKSKGSCCRASQVINK